MYDSFVYNADLFHFTLLVYPRKTIWDFIFSQERIFSDSESYMSDVSFYYTVHEVLIIF